jgi:hypothetical protein
MLLLLNGENGGEKCYDPVLDSPIGALRHIK